MKIIHCADIHLDSRFVGLSPKSASARRNEVLSTFLQLVAFASENADALIIAGDLFDSRYPSPSTVTTVYKAFAQQSKLQIFLLNGNHDGATLNTFASDKPLPNLHIFGKNWSSFALDGKVVISGIDLTLADKEDFCALNLNKNNYNVVVMHGYEEVDLHFLTKFPIDYLALGHLHSYKQFRLGRGFGCYCGCLEPRGFDESGESGYLTVDTDSPDASIRLTPLATRRVEKVTVDLTDVTDNATLLTTLTTALAPLNRDNYLQIVFTGGKAEGVDLSLVGSITKDFFAVNVNDESFVAIDVARLISEGGITGEFVRLVTQSKLENKRQEDVLVMGVNALNGEVDKI